LLTPSSTQFFKELEYDEAVVLELEQLAHTVVVVIEGGRLDSAQVVVLQ
jgi:hypothetical protein